MVTRNAKSVGSLGDNRSMSSVSGRYLSATQYGSRKSVNLVITGELLLGETTTKVEDPQERFRRVVGVVLRRQRRKIQGLSQAKLAEKAGITQATLSYVENGERAASLATLERIASALNVNLSTLLAFVEQVCEMPVDELREKIEKV